jgi:predicted lipid-binding transport protein (Tim44 family)
MNNVQMMTGVLSATSMNFVERAGYAGRMLLVGMLAVFAVLTLIWGVLALSRIFLAGTADKKPAEAPKAAPAPKAPAAPAAPAVVPAAADDAATVAAISAAIAAYLAAENGGKAEDYVGGFRVVSFRRVGGGAWNSRK